jgi:glycerophosphoryl diester phosphodiesterase
MGASMGPLITIAHRGGNSRALLQEALASGVDAVEADLRLDGRRLVARHDRRFPLLPLYYDKWFAYWSCQPQVDLDEILERIEGRASLFVDIKSTSARALDMLLGTLRRRQVVAETRISGTYWHLLRRLHEEEPGLRLHYTIGDEESLDRFRQLLAGGEDTSGVAIHEALVDEDLAARFRARGIEIVAYHVDEWARARQLREWGVSGITSDDFALLRALKDERPPPAR